MVVLTVYSLVTSDCVDRLNYFEDASCQIYLIEAFYHKLMVNHINSFLCINFYVCLILAFIFLMWYIIII